MLKIERIRSLSKSSLFEESYDEGDNPLAPFALPDSAVSFLIKLAREVGTSSVFEFGSGSSTRALLKSGFSVTSLEDSGYWMDKTCDELSEADKSRHTALVRPLKLRWHGLIPAMDWKLDQELIKRIQAADLILIDSPAYPPFRESTLFQVLACSSPCVVILDDTRIPTLSRFCDQMAAANPESLFHRRVRVGHCFDVFARVDESPLRIRQNPLGILKGYRRLANWRPLKAGDA